jgi:hypothetical protein
VVALYRSTKRSRVYGRRQRLCHEDGCATLVFNHKLYCTEHREIRRAKWRARPSTNDRDYGVNHQNVRRGYVEAMAGGYLFRCTRCPEYIYPGELWDLDHSDDRTHYLGPAHRACNRAAAARKKNRSPVA